MKAKRHIHKFFLTAKKNEKKQKRNKKQTNQQMHNFLYDSFPSKHCRQSQYISKTTHGTADEKPKFIIT